MKVVTFRQRSQEGVVSLNIERIESVMQMTDQAGTAKISMFSGIEIYVAVSIDEVLRQLNDAEAEAG